MSFEIKVSQIWTDFDLVRFEIMNEFGGYLLVKDLKSDALSIVPRDVILEYFYLEEYDNKYLHS